jgi:hypothetical protein
VYTDLVAVELGVPDFCGPIVELVTFTQVTLEGVTNELIPDEQFSVADGVAA